MSGYVSDCCGAKVILVGGRLRKVYACSECDKECGVNILRGNG